MLYINDINKLSVKNNNIFIDSGGFIKLANSHILIEILPQSKIEFNKFKNILNNIQLADNIVDIINIINIISPTIGTFRITQSVFLDIIEIFKEFDLNIFQQELIDEDYYNFNKINKLILINSKINYKLLQFYRNYRGDLIITFNQLSTNLISTRLALKYIKSFDITLIDFINHCKIESLKHI